MRHGRRLALWLLLVATIVMATGGLFAGEEQLVGVVVGISDGDTIRVMVAGAEVRVRLAGIDSPEKGQPFSAKAKAFVGEACFQKLVTMRVQGKDRYGRLLAEVVLPDGKILNHALVSAGMAWWFRRYAEGDVVLQRLEAEAILERRGLWAEVAPIAPWAWRARGK